MTMVDGITRRHFRLPQRMPQGLHGNWIPKI